MIRTVDLTKVYPGTDVKAVDGLNLSVRRGEIFGLLGPNGAGKTTTAGMLTTRVLPTSGQAVVGGIDVVAHPALAKQVIGVVTQQNTLDRALTVWENLYYHGRLFGMPAKDARAAADQLLEQFHLTNWAKASVFALSGGMAQRLMVARSILHRPDILFLDEPTAGLDPQSRIALWEILGELHRAGQTILLTTHYMEEADQLCQRLAIMDHGKILALDTPAGLKASVGADSIVTVHSTGDLAGLARVLADIDGGAVGHQCRREHRCPRQGRVEHSAANRHLGRAPRLRGPGSVSGRADSRDGLHQTDRQGAEGLMTTTSTEAVAGGDTVAPPTYPGARRGRSAAEASREAFVALLQRDLTVLRKNMGEFVGRTVIQPFLLVFVFLYVFPQIGQGIGSGGGTAGESQFASVLIAGVVGISIMFQGIMAVALPMATEFGYTKEIEDRVLAPMPVWLVAAGKVMAGAVQGLIAAAIVFPIASVVHARGVHAHLAVHWPILLTLLPIACVMCASLGLLLGTRVEPRNIGAMFGFIVLPMTFLGGTYYTTRGRRCSTCGCSASRGCKPWCSSTRCSTSPRASAPL